MREQAPAPNANREGQETGQYKGAGPEAQPGVRTPDGQIRTQGHAVEGQSTASSPHPSRPA
jgi:hypothetical protein